MSQQHLPMGMGLDRWLFGLVGFAISGLSGGAVTMLLVLGLKSDDVFAFSGALIGALVGAVGTVLGAAWLGDRSINRERNEERSDIVNEVEHVLEKAHSTQSYFNPQGSFADGWHEKLSATYQDMLIARDYFREVIDHAKTVNFRQRREIKLLERAISHFVSFYDTVMAPEYEDDPYDDRTFDGLLREIMEQGFVTGASFGDGPANLFGLRRSRI